jgi:hypothetical protein
METMHKPPPSKKKLKKAKNTKPKTAKRRRSTKKKKYKVRNWREYNEMLVQRGAVTVWVSEEDVKGWIFKGPQNQGHPLIFSDMAIQSFLTIRSVFHLPLRQTEGFLCSLFRSLHLTLPIPDYTTVSKRMDGILVDLPVRGTSPGETIDIVIVRGFSVWRELRKRKSGTVAVDLDKRCISLRDS